MLSIMSSYRRLRRPGKLDFLDPHQAGVLQEYREHLQEVARVNIEHYSQTNGWPPGDRDEVLGALGLLPGQVSPSARNRKRRGGMTPS